MRINELSFILVKYLLKFNLGIDNMEKGCMFVPQ